jgi:TRAP-type uncharacterized transport system fused permease subunit
MAIQILLLFSFTGAFTTLQDRVHTALVYHSHYFQWQSSDKNKIRWCDLLMLSVLLYIYIYLVTEMKDLHHENTSVCIGIRVNPTDMLAMIPGSIRKFPD